MKKLTLKANAFNKGEVPTRAQLKKVMGGYDRGGAGGSCTVTFNCGASGSVSCSSDAGICHRQAATETENAYVQCDSDPKVYC